MHSKILISVISIGLEFLSNCKVGVVLKNIGLCGLLLLWTVVYWGCGKNTAPEDRIAPTKPVLLPQANYATASDSVCGPYDQGAVASNGFHLMWRPGEDVDLAYWQIYFRLVDSHDSPILAGTHPTQIGGTEFVIRDLRILPDSMYNTRVIEYWINAVDQSGNVSASSDAIRFRLLPKAEGVNVSNISTGLPTFTGQYPSNDLLTAPNRYSVKVRKGRQIIWLYQRIEPLRQVNVRFNDDGTVPDSLLTASRQMLPGTYEVGIEFWTGDSAGSIASVPFNIAITQP